MDTEAEEWVRVGSRGDGGSVGGKRGVRRGEGGKGVRRGEGEGGGEESEGRGKIREEVIREEVRPIVANLVRHFRDRYF